MAQSFTAATCPACGAGDQPEGANFCGQCGSALRATCGACGSTLAPGARFCQACGAPAGTDAAAGTSPSADGGRKPGSPVAERRVTSVLFCDLVGFTTLSETRDHEQTRELLTALLRRRPRHRRPLRGHRREVHR